MAERRSWLQLIADCSGVGLGEAERSGEAQSEAAVNLRSGAE